MNRLIKFIAWDKKDNILTYPKPMQVLRNKFFTESKHFIFLQFTGVYDNTKWEELTESERCEYLNKDNENRILNWQGKEIFEGDSVEFTTADGIKRTGIIKYNFDGFDIWDGKQERSLRGFRKYHSKTNTQVNVRIINRFNGEFYNGN